MPQLHLTQRFASSLFIGLLHLLILAALLQHANSARIEETGPVEYMSYIVVPKPAAPAVREAAPPTAPPPVRRDRPAVATAEAPRVPNDTSVPDPVDAPAETVAPAPATAAAPSPKLDMAALRADAGRMSRDYVPEPFEQVRSAESRLEAEKRDLGRAIEKAKRPPCTKKYSGGTSLNLILLIPLAIDTITDKGCKW